jgi:hypothetical protein
MGDSLGLTRYLLVCIDMQVVLQWLLWLEAELLISI